MKNMWIINSMKTGRPSVDNAASSPGKRGFTLLEVMIAMAILAIALVAVYRSQSQSISMAGDSRFQTTAALLAQGRMAQLDAADPAGVKAERGDFGDDFPGYSWQVVIEDTEIKLIKKLVVKVVNNRLTRRNEYRLI